MAVLHALAPTLVGAQPRLVSIDTLKDGRTNAGASASVVVMADGRAAITESAGSRRRIRIEGWRSQSYDEVSYPQKSDDNRHLAFCARRSDSIFVVVDTTERPLKTERCPEKIFFSSTGRHWATVAGQAERQTIVVDGVASAAYQTVRALGFAGEQFAAEALEIGSRPAYERWRVYLGGRVLPEIFLRLQLTGSDHVENGHLLVAGRTIEGQDVILVDDRTAFRTPAAAGSQSTLGKAWVSSDGEAIYALANKVNDGRQGRALTYDVFRRGIVIATNASDPAVTFAPRGSRFILTHGTLSRDQLQIRDDRGASYNRYANISAVVFSPDGKRVALNVGNAAGSRFLIIDGQEVPEIFSDLTALKYSTSRGKFVAIANRSPAVWIDESGMPLSELSDGGRSGYPQTRDSISFIINDRQLITSDFAVPAYPQRLQWGEDSVLYVLQPTGLFKNGKLVRAQKEASPSACTLGACDLAPWVLASRDNLVALVSADSKVHLHINGQRVSTLGSPDGNGFIMQIDVTRAFGIVPLYDAKTGAKLTVRMQLALQ